MTLAEICALAAGIFFAIYSVACSVESGVAINLVSDKKASSRRFFTPLWEVTNVFLVFGFTAVAMLFSNALETLSAKLFGFMVIGLSALIIRACIVLTIFYWRSDKLPKWLAWSFLVCCFAIPLSFAAAGAYLFTGQMFWQSFTGWTVMVAALLGIVSVGLLTMNSKRKALFLSNELAFAAWMVVLGSVLPLVAKLALPHLQKLPLLILSVLCIGGLAATLVAANSPKFRLWRYAVLVTFLAPLLLGWAGRPYLIANQLTLESAFSAQSYAGAFIIGTAVVLPLILLGFFLFWKLLKQPE